MQWLVGLGDGEEDTFSMFCYTEANIKFVFSGMLEIEVQQGILFGLD